VALAEMLVDPGNVMLMDEPTNHLDLASSEALAEALATYDGTLVFVSHNRSFVRRLATRIWDVADGKVETYPGTLDEYLYSMSHRFDGDGAGAGAGASASTSGVTGTSKKPVAAMSAAPDVGTTKKRNAIDDKDRKRKEAELRNLRSKKLKPLEKRALELEARITELENEQKRIARELEDPAVYGDEKERYELLTALQVNQDKVEELTERWTGTHEEIEAAEKELAKAEAELADS
jgi:ATP-binding cassette subfamily F protein 3